MTGVAVAALGSLAVVVPVAIPLTVAAAGCVIAVTWWPVSRAWLPGLTASAGVVSAVATIGHLLLGWPGVPSWGLAEVALLSVLVGAVVRWGPVRLAASASVVAGIAVAVTVLRAEPDSGAEQLSTLESVYVAAFWALGPIAMAALGILGRQLEARRVRAVAEAGRAQRLELARDLHDFVAHDISAMIAQAQAAQTMTPADGPVGAALGKIEAAGLAAMASMDRTVGILRGADDVADAGPDDADGTDHAEPPAGPGLDDLPQLVERFDAAGLTRVRLDVEDGLPERMPREIDSTVHRVVVEALTNVRRHAPAARLVEIVIRSGDGAVDVAVTNDAGGSVGGESSRRGGVGLPALTERVEALSGTFHAGPCGDGWQVTASVPVTATREVVP